ncbi:MAG: hypothetical protein HY821_20305 [Acidobacteria bacterium]|nr:hypothetical protein [Acidobacteriota bacterium]
MRYWAYLLANLSGAGFLLAALWQALEILLPEPEIFLYTRLPRFPNDLPWTTAILFFWLIAIGLLYFCVWDQRRRCRTCGRVLLMPVESGNWSRATLFSPPRVASICPYGHGTFEQPESHTSVQTPAEWHAHGDMWQELEEISRRR